VNQTMDERYEFLEAYVERMDQWANKVSEFMATDKSNDWSEELAELEEIRS
jgi:hypothetical protein